MWSSFSYMNSSTSASQRTVARSTRPSLECYSITVTAPVDWLRLGGTSGSVPQDQLVQNFRTLAPTKTAKHLAGHH